MCQKPITRDNAVQLVEKGKTELITGFISKKGRPFDAYLVRNGAKISWEFPPRKAAAKGANGEAKAPRKPKAPRDLSTANRLGESRLHDGELMQTEDAYVVRKKNADGSDRVVFELKRSLCQKDIPVDEVERLVETGKTGLIEGFVSKRGSNFSAYLVLSKDKKKAEFEFPPR
jgi:DNA topoisomerase-3